MGELDPFGREKGEDSLKEMGWNLPSAEPATAATAAPAAGAPQSGIAAQSGAAAQSGIAAPQTSAAQSGIAAPQTSATPGLGRVRPPRRRGGRGLFLLRAVVPLAVIAAVAAAVIGGVRTGSRFHTISIPKLTIPKLTVPTGPIVTPAKPSKPIAGARTSSLLRPAGIAAAMARLRPLGRPYILRLAADRINAQVVHGTQLRIVQIGRDGSFVRTDVTGVGGSLRTFSWSQVDPEAPARLIRAAGRGARSVNYLVLSRFGTGVRLGLYLTSGAYYSADAHGRGAQRLG